MDINQRSRAANNTAVIDNNNHIELVGLAQQLTQFLASGS